MTRGVEVEFMRDNASDATVFRGRIDHTALSQAITDAVLAEIVRQVATRWVDQNFALVAAHLDPQAVANLAVAAAGAAVNRTLQERLPGPGPSTVEVNNIHLPPPKRGPFGF